MGMEKEFVAWSIAIISALIALLFLSRFRIAGKTVMQMEENILLLVVGRVMAAMGLV